MERDAPGDAFIPSRLAGAMSLLFWGTILIVVDVTLQMGSVWIDLVPDIVGWALILAMIPSLRAAAPGLELQHETIYVTAFAGLGASFVALVFPGPIEPWMLVIGLCMHLLYMGGLFALCRVMAHVCERDGASELARRWSATGRFATHVLIPVSIVWCLISVAEAGAGWQTVDVGAADSGGSGQLVVILLALAAIGVMLVHFLTTVHRTRLAAQWGYVE